MVKFFLLTERIEDILERREELTLKELTSFVKRLDVVRYLHRIYSNPSDIKLTASDYRNLYDIFYLLSVQAYDEDYSEKRALISNNAVASIKRNPNNIIEQLQQIIN